jgi:hypothetical protein
MAKKALLLGAGFSYDLGMPLVTGLTQDFFHFLTPSRMHEYLEIWKIANPFGDERPINSSEMDEVLDIYQQYFDNREKNYEEFLKEIQDRSNELGANQTRVDTMHFLSSKLIDILFQMLWMYQVNNLRIYMMNKKFYKSFADLLSNNELWVLSLNHDLILEFLCFDYGIPINFGSTEKVAFPKSNYNFNEYVIFGKTSRLEMKLDKMNFTRDKPGVNLIKLHGAINEFSYNDDKYILHIEPQVNETPVSYLEKTNTVLHKMKYYVNGKTAPIIGEIGVSDFEGNMQFLRKSILTGGYKYSETLDPKKGEEKISLMEEVLSSVDEIIVIGYGFGDHHINLRLYNAMLLNPDLKVFIIDPYRTKTPDILKPFDYKMRIQRVMCSSAEGLSYIAKGQWDQKLSDELKKAREIRSFLDTEYRKRFLSP